MNTDNRPRDWAYIAAFNCKDLPSLYEMTRQIHNSPQLLEEFYNKCESSAQGKQENIEVNGNKIQFEEVIKSEDLMTNNGLQQCINIILGTSAVRWRYIGYGNSSATSTPLVTDIALNNESVNPRLDMTLLGGWNQAIGMKLFFGGIIGESVSGIVVVAMGVFNNTAGVTMLNHNIFTANGLTRTTATDKVFILASVVEFCPVV